MLLDDYSNQIQNDRHLFFIDKSNLVFTYDEYLKQYANVIRYICLKGEKANYQINCISYPFMFLLRHFFELLLKSEIGKTEKIIPHTHSFEDLYLELGLIPENIKKSIQLINFDRDGSCFRYLFNIDDEIHQLPSRIELHNLFIEYNSENIFNPILCGINNFDRKLVWEFTMHMHEIQYSGQLRTQYDTCLCYLIKGVLCAEIKIEDILYPLMFLFRHSIELALKNNIYDIIELETDPTLKEKKLNKVSQIHSLTQLNNIYSVYLDEIDTSKLSLEYRKDYLTFKSNSESLYSALHSLDNNSKIFRFPQENNDLRSISKSYVVDNLKIYYDSDAFITFAVNVLKEQGLVPLSNDEMYTWFGTTY